MDKKLIKNALLSLLFVICVLLTTVRAYAEVYQANGLKELESRIYGALSARTPRFTLSYTGDIANLKSDIKNSINQIFETDEYLHYSSKGYSYSFTGSDESAEITFSFSYWENASQAEFVNSKVQAVLSEIITSEMSDVQKEKVIHDWIVRNLVYDTSLTRHSAYSGLVKPYKTVCQGYSLLGYKMLNSAGIETKIIEGKADGQPHAWNLVKLSGNWYHLDLTWDDPVPDAREKINYNYFNLSDAQIKSDHSWVKQYPEATGNFSALLSDIIQKDPSNPFYSDLYKTLGLKYLSPELTVSSRTELSHRIKQAVAGNQSELKVRYMRGNTAAEDLMAVLASFRSIYSYNFSKTEFTRSPEENDIILDFKFKSSNTNKNTASNLH